MYGATTDQQIQELLSEKQEKIAALEKCAGKKQGWMIAGISTIGLTAAGVAGNIVLANKNKEIDAELSAEKSKLVTAQQKMKEKQKIAEKQRQEQIEKAKQVCEEKQGDDEKKECLVTLSSKGTGVEKTVVFASLAIKDEKKDLKKDVEKGAEIPVANVGPDEPDVDATKWTRETYQLCMANFYRSHTRIVTSNMSARAGVRWYWAKSHNGKWCEGYQYGKYFYDYKNNPNPCTSSKFPSLGNGEWMVTLQNGKNIRGIGMCSTTPGAVRDELRDDIDTSGDGIYCWCRITQTELSECLETPHFSWMYMEEDFSPVDADHIEYDKNSRTKPDEYYQIGENDCLWRCADECGQRIFDYGTHRIRAMHGVPWIDLYEVDRQELYNKMHS